MKEYNTVIWYNTSIINKYYKYYIWDDTLLYDFSKLKKVNEVWKRKMKIKKLKKLLNEKICFR